MIFDRFKYRTIERSFLRMLFKSKTQVRPLSNDKIITVGVLVETSELQESEILSSISQHLMVPDHCIEFFKFEVQPIKKEMDSNVCSSKSFGWFGSLKLNSLHEFVKKDFDLFINYGISENLYLNMITLQSKSKFKIGFATEFTDLYDLSVSDPKRDIESFNLEAAKYLKILKKI
ncbi:MAG: DUF6913 domain-containing protein [Flavicella sp.]